jgi:hypothetical protein
VVIFLWIVAVLELIGGAFVLFVTSRSAIHEILGMLAIGFAFLTGGVGAILQEMQEWRNQYHSEIKSMADHLGAMRKYYEPER